MARECGSDEWWLWWHVVHESDQYSLIMGTFWGDPLRTGLSVGLGAGFGQGGTPTPPSMSDIITEGSDPIITEGSDNLITET